MPLPPARTAPLASGPWLLRLALCAAATLQAGVGLLLAGACHAQHAQDPAPAQGIPPLQQVVIEDRAEQAAVDRQRQQLLQRLAVHGALPDTAQFAPDGRHLFMGAANGWLRKYDVHQGTLVAQVRSGERLRALALNADGQWLLAAHDAPATLTLLDADLRIAKHLPTTTLDGKTASGVAALRDHRARKSFVVALRDIPELWEVSYDPHAAPIYDGLVHDYKMGEALAKPGFHNARRTQLERPLSSIWVDPASALVVGVQSPHAPTDDAAMVQVLHLDIRRKIAELRIPGLPQLERAAPFTQEGTPMLWLPNAIRAEADVINRRTWRIDRTAPLHQAPKPLLPNPTRQP